MIYCSNYQLLLRLRSCEFSILLIQHWTKSPTSMLEEVNLNLYTIQVFSLKHRLDSRFLLTSHFTLLFIWIFSCTPLFFIILLQIYSIIELYLRFEKCVISMSTSIILNNAYNSNINVQSPKHIKDALCLISSNRKYMTKTTKFVFYPFFSFAFLLANSLWVFGKNDFIHW